MAGLQLSGLASGFDWLSVVDQLVELQRVPQDRMRTEKTSNTSKLSAFSTLRTKLTALQTATTALSSDSLFNQRTAASSNTASSWAVSAANGASAGEYVVDVSKIATHSVRSGAANVAGGLNPTSDVSGLVLSEMRLATAVTEGTFTINDAQIDILSTDTLQEVFDKISAATSGAVTASYDAGTDRISLSSAAEISLGSGVDTSNFLYAAKLFNNGSNSIQSASNLGTLSLDDTIADAGLAGAITAVDGSGNGSFSVNGIAIAFNVNDDSIRDVMNRVNESAAGVTMSYDSANDRFTLTNRNTGDLGISASETAGGLLDALGLSGSATLTRGTNAEFTVNGGGTIVTPTNTFDETALGVPGLSVTATSVGAETITVSSDTESIDEGIRGFITAFNDLQSYIDTQTNVTISSEGEVEAALMAGNQEMTSIARELRSLAFDAVAGASATMSRLESIGIDFDGSSSQLSVRDEGKFSQALKSNLSDVAKLFSTSETGISNRIDSYLTQLTETNGLVDIQENSLERQNRSLDQQIADIERRLVAERTRLEGSFIRMEEAQSLMNSQLAALQSTLNL
ncbi:MAG: flagellar filament capping protein FliD [Opitutaceae bacterium]